MTPERWRQIEDLYHAAQGCAPAQRVALLERTDPDIRSRVERMLAMDSGGEMLDRPATELLDETTASTMAAGSQLGPYRIDGPLSAGGMGTVYRATDLRLGRVVAIKIAMARYSERFEREARAISTLNHPHICTLHDVGPNYLVMELVEGTTLEAEIGKGPLPPSKVARFGAQIASALAEAHAHGIVHRDLKPPNVMVTRHGLKVLDFGIAKNSTEAPLTEANMVVGTPAYMAPEQMRGHDADARADLFALGLVLYEMTVGRLPFPGASLGLMLASGSQTSVSPPSQERAAVPASLDSLIVRLLQKDPAQRPQSALEVAGELTALADQLDAPASMSRSVWRPLPIAAAIVFLLVVAGGAWFYRQSERRHWAREEAIPEITRLTGEGKSLAAFLVLRRAEEYLPGDPQLAQVAKTSTQFTSIGSTPAGAKVEMQDYLSPGGDWLVLGTTPLERIRIPAGYFRWKVSKPGVGEFIAAPFTDAKMQFALGAAVAAPPGMVPVPGGTLDNDIDFIGWVQYKLPPYDIDKFEVTNRQYQAFVDQGGYRNREYWKEPFARDGKELTWDQAMDVFRDPTGRPGPSTWQGGHFPPGKDDYPVSGVSWYEAAAYAARAGHDLPAFAEFYNAAPPDVARFAINESNFEGRGPMPVGRSASVGPYGTYDMTGNVREWALNADDEGRRFILGGAWNTQTYAAYDSEALNPFDRSPSNGFRTVRNGQPLPPATAAPVVSLKRDFTRAKPASDEVFAAYKEMYDYDTGRPLNAQSQGIVENTADWSKEKIVIDAGFGNERFSVFLFLPKNVRPPLQAVVFFPSARVNTMPSSQNLGDMDFVDYAIQSGRALMYPIYLGTYEAAREGQPSPGDSGSREFLIRQSREVRRSVDYLQTRPEIDKTKLAYLGVSQGSADGIVFATLEDRFKAIVFLDGGFFLGPPDPGVDQVDFAPRLKRPVLMVNGRYDYTFSPDRSQLPMFRMIGTPDADKKHVVFDTPHDVSQRKPELAREVLAWLDKYLGKVE